MTLALILALNAQWPSQAQTQTPFEKLELGNDHGLTDMNGKELLPPIYAGVHYLGHGLFLLKQRSPEPEKRFDCTREKILINQSLTKLETPVPQNTTFERVLWLGKRADSSADFVIKEIPEDALLVFRTAQYSGVCDGKGRQILPADCVWIGNLCQGIVALRKSDDQLYSFNFETRTLQKLAYQKVRRDIRLAFREGLAVFASEATPKIKSMWGFMDTGGNVAIEPKFDFAWPFEGGLACVRHPADDNDSGAHNELIDKSGKMASPNNLEVIATLGSYIEVKNSAGNYGVVNHQFKYVIEPKYQSICAQIINPPTVAEFGTWDSTFAEPIYYYAKRSEDGKCVILSGRGDVILEVPPALAWHRTNISPVFSNGAFACNRGLGMPLAKATFINLKGEVVPAPFSNLSDSKDIVFDQIAPGILLKTKYCSSELRDKYMFPRAIGQFPRHQEKKNFRDPRDLRDYICEPLKAAVDSFNDGHYQDALLKIRLANLDEHRDPLYQPAYIRGICLQQIGNFEAAEKEYATIIKSSNDEELKKRSHMGLASCARQQPSVPSDMLTFPTRWERKGTVDIPLY